VRERGSVPIEFALAVSVLLIPMVVLVALAPRWVEHRAGARVAAAEVARLVVTGDGSASTELRAASLGREIASNYGLSEVRVSLCPTGAFDEASSCGRLGRGEVAEVRVSVLTPAVDFPLLRSFGAVWITVSHSEQVDLYRSRP
jgi:hypothetical protein